MVPMTVVCKLSHRKATLVAALLMVVSGRLYKQLGITKSQNKFLA